jgi:hypothetical protein
VTVIDPPPLRTLPFSAWWPVLLGALAGVLLRLVFSGKPGHAYAPMLGAFIYCSPLMVGAVTVYAAERVARRSWGYYFWAPFLANLFYVGGTLLIMVEGLVCALLILPMFALLGATGGLIMGAVCRITDWPARVLHVFWALPLVLGAVENQLPLPQHERMVERVLLIDAPPQRIWQEIHTARHIRPEEVKHALLFRVGVPLPEAGVSETVNGERVRHISMGKAVHFDQVVTDWDENRKVAWVHRYAADSFPPYALDEHVVLGGHYFDITHTSYELTPREGGTELRLRMGYRVSTPFNWYADPLARLMLGNIESVLLQFYRGRAESR